MARGTCSFYGATFWRSRRLTTLLATWFFRFLGEVWGVGDAARLGVGVLSFSDDEDVSEDPSLCTLHGCFQGHWKSLIAPFPHPPSLALTPPHPLKIMSYQLMSKKLHKQCPTTSTSEKMFMALFISDTFWFSSLANAFPGRMPSTFGCLSNRHA